MQDLGEDWLLLVGLDQELSITLCGCASDEGRWHRGKQQNDSSVSKSWEAGGVWCLLPLLTCFPLPQT